MQCTLILNLFESINLIKFKIIWLFKEGRVALSLKWCGGVPADGLTELRGDRRDVRDDRRGPRGCMNVSLLWAEPIGWMQLPTRHCSLGSFTCNTLSMSIFPHALLCTVADSWTNFVGKNWCLLFFIRSYFVNESRNCYSYSLTIPCGWICMEICMSSICGFLHVSLWSREYSFRCLISCTNCYLSCHQCSE